MSNLMRIACLALIGAAGGTAYAGGQQETDAAATGKAQERKTPTSPTWTTVGAR